MVTAMRHAIFDLSGKFLRQEVGIYLAEERRLVPVGPLEARHRRIVFSGLPWSMARCPKHRDSLKCYDVYCPRHQPDAYANYQARHATDTISPC